MALARILVAGLACLAPASALAGAWTFEEGGGQVSWNALVSSAHRAFDANGRRASIPRYLKAEDQLLLEYGVTDWLTAIIGPGLQHVEIAAPVNARRTGFGMSEFGARLRLWQSDGWVVSTQVLARVPGTSQAGNPAALGYTDAEYDLRALVGKNFTLANMPAFIDVQIAQRFRAGAPPDEFRADFTLGVEVAPRWMVLAQAFNVVSQGAGQAPFNASYDYSKAQLSVVHAVTPAWSVQAGAFTTYRGRNALVENGLVFGVWYKF